MLSVNHLSFSYGRNHLLRDISFTLHPGECTVLCGPNGSGKSTLLSLLAGILSPQKGSIRAEGSIGYVPQGTGLFEDMTVQDNLSFFAGLSGCRIPEKLPFDILSYRSKKVSALSGGMKKRVSIACALLGDPEIILLDEPCAGLDIEYRDEFRSLLRDLKERGRLILYISHEPAEFFGLYDRLIFLGGEQPLILTASQLPGYTGADTATQNELETAYRTLIREAAKKGKMS